MVSRIGVSRESEHFIGYLVVACKVIVIVRARNGLKEESYFFFVGNKNNQKVSLKIRSCSSGGAFAHLQAMED